MHEKSCANLMKSAPGESAYQRAEAAHHPDDESSIYPLSGEEDRVRIAWNGKIHAIMRYWEKQMIEQG